MTHPQPDNTKSKQRMIEQLAEIIDSHFQARLEHPDRAAYTLAPTARRSANLVTRNKSCLGKSARAAKFWQGLILDKDPTKQEIKLDIVRHAISELVKTLPHKGGNTRHSIAILLVKQLCANDIPVISRQEDSKKHETWRNTMIDLLRIAGNKYVFAHTNNKAHITHGVSGEDILMMWRKTAEMWDEQNRVVLLAPVRSMASIAGMLTITQVMKMDDLDDLHPDFLNTMARSDYKPIRTMIEKGGTAEKFDEILARSKKNRLEKTAGIENNATVLKNPAQPRM